MQALKIAYLFPDLLNLYGDGGNVTCLRKRCEWRAIPVEVVMVRHGEHIDFSQVDIVFLGGGPDREQRLAAEELLRMKEDLRAYVEDDGVLLAICGGYQLLGTEWLLGSESVEGLGIIDMVTRPGGVDRLIDNIVVETTVCKSPVVGYENHAGRTVLGAKMLPFGKVVSKTGHGNNDESGCDGVLYRNLIGSYLHGPLLGKNPEVADYLLKRALEKRQGSPVTLAALDDAVEAAANAFVCEHC